jgi:hypothetical protein
MSEGEFSKVREKVCYLVQTINTVGRWDRGYVISLSLRHEHELIGKEQTICQAMGNKSNF